MKFNFKIQQYQTDAVDAVVNVFSGQEYRDKVEYVIDMGKKKIVQSEPYQLSLKVAEEQLSALEEDNLFDDTWYKNEVVQLNDQDLLANIQKLQR